LGQHPAIFADRPQRTALDVGDRLLRRAARSVREILVDESDRHAAFSDCGRDPLDWTQPDIAARENAGDARLKEVGVARVCPPSRLHYVVAGQHIAPPVASNLRWQPRPPR
jgi:hypothetical protein